MKVRICFAFDKNNNFQNILKVYYLQWYNVIYLPNNRLIRFRYIIICICFIIRFSGTVSACEPNNWCYIELIIVLILIGVCYESMININTYRGQLTIKKIYCEKTMENVVESFCSLFFSPIIYLPIQFDVEITFYINYLNTNVPIYGNRVDMLISGQISILYSSRGKLPRF